MDNRTIEEVRANEDRLINRLEKLENRLSKIKEIAEELEWRKDDVHDLIDGYYDILNLVEGVI